MAHYELTIENTPFHRELTRLKDMLYYILLREEPGTVAGLIDYLYPEDPDMFNGEWVDVLYQGLHSQGDVAVAIALYGDKCNFEMKCYDHLLERVAQDWSESLEDEFDDGLTEKHLAEVNDTYILRKVDD